MDRYELSRIKRDDLRKMLTKLRREEKRVYDILQAAGVDYDFSDNFRDRSKRRDINTKLRTINEYLRIQKAIKSVGRDGEKAIAADRTLTKYIADRNADNLDKGREGFIQNTPENRKALTRFIKQFKESTIGKIVYRGDAVDFFERHGKDSNIDDMLKLYENYVKRG